MVTSTDDFEEFGYVLRQMRRQCNLSQEALAARLGVSGSYISRIERGQRQVPGRGTVLRIANTLEIDAKETNRLLFSAGYAPLPRNDTESTDPTLSLIADIFRDERVSQTELAPLKEYARLLDRLRKQR